MWSVLMYSFGLQHLLDICRKYRQWRSTRDLHGYCHQANEDYSFTFSSPIEGYAKNYNSIFEKLRWRVRVHIRYRNYMYDICIMLKYCAAIWLNFYRVQFLFLEKYWVRFLQGTFSPGYMFSPTFVESCKWIRACRTSSWSEMSNVFILHI